MIESPSLNAVGVPENINPTQHALNEHDGKASEIANRIF